MTFSPNTPFDSGLHKRKWYSLSRFDRKVTLVLASLVVITVIVVLLGDRVGTQVVSFYPNGKARSSDSIVLAFNEMMDQESVMQRLRMEPPIEGEYIWSGMRLMFQPKYPLMTGTEYTVSLAKGAKSTGEREVLADYRYRFTVRFPRVAYLSPVDGSAPANIWITDPDDLSRTEQITAIETGVNSYDVSPDGRKIAFSAQGTTGKGVDIWVLDLENKKIQQVTDCPDSACTLPIWRPDGQLIAYTRSYINSNLTGKTVTGESLRGGLPRVWVVDLTADPYVTRQLVEDSQVLGEAINWSSDGNRLNFFDIDKGTSFVYDFKEQRTITIENPYGQPAALSPDGKQIVYPQFVQPDPSKPLTLHLQLRDLESQAVRDVSGGEQNSQGDSNPAWQPNGEGLVFVRRDTARNANQASQIYLLKMSDSSLQTLVADPERTSSGFVWDSTGQQFLMQRFTVPTDASQVGLPEIWSYAIKDGALTQLVSNAVEPHWIP